MGPAEAGLRTMKSDVELRQQVGALRRDERNGHAMAHILATYALIAANLWVLANYPGWVTWVVSFFFLGFMQYRLVMSTHEAVHKTLLFPEKVNEFFGVFHAALVGISFFNYRRTHLEHHRNPQSIDDDIDSYIYKPLLECKPGFRRFGLLVFGVVVDIAEKVARKIRGARRKNSALANPQNANALPTQMVPILLCQGALFALFAFTMSWWCYFVFWVMPVLLVALSLDRARTFLEHGYQYIFSDQTWENFQQAPQSTIDVDTNPIERFFFAPFGFAYHQAHHTYLTVPFYNLPKLADLLEQKESSYYRRVHGSYLGILTRMVWAAK